MGLKLIVNNEKMVEKQESNNLEVEEIFDEEEGVCFGLRPVHSEIDEVEFNIIKLHMEIERGIYIKKFFKENPKSKLFDQVNKTFLDAQSAGSDFDITVKKQNLEELYKKYLKLERASKCQLKLC